MMESIPQGCDLKEVKISAIYEDSNVSGYQVVSVHQMGNKLFQSVAEAKKTLKRVNGSVSQQEPWGQFPIRMIGTAFAATVLYCIYTFAFTLMLRQWV